jgi:DUF4097 and DUF4098 domain-containing protein YvlB
VGEVADVVERRFRTPGPPRLHVDNAAGETVARATEGEEVVVRARKRVHADSAERARRVLDNVVVDMDQDGDEIRVSQRAFLVDRGIAGLFREGRAAVDYEIDLPRQASVTARSTSGEITVAGVKGSVELQSVSGDISVDGVRGALHVRTVSGACRAGGCAGVLEANTISGDLTLERCALRGAGVRTVSGDVEAEAVLAPEGRYSIVTVSGDVALATPSPCAVRFQTASGDLSTGGGLEVSRASPREHLVRQGSGGPEVVVRTVSGDLEIERRDIASVPPTEPEAAILPARDRKAEAMDVLERLARGELDAEEAGRRLDAAR